MLKSVWKQATEDRDWLEEIQTKYDWVCFELKALQSEKHTDIEWREKEIMELKLRIAT